MLTFFPIIDVTRRPRGHTSKFFNSTRDKGVSSSCGYKTSLAKKRLCNKFKVKKSIKLVSRRYQSGVVVRVYGVVIRASASQSVDLRFIPLVESYRKTLKNGIHSFPALRLAFMEGCGEQAGKFGCCVLGQGT